MRHFQLKDERLKAVLAMLGKCETLADVGCDHGYLSAAAILSGAAMYALASDVSSVSAKKAEKLAQRLGLSGLMSVVCGDGLAPIGAEEPPYSIAVCGMGGELIARILEEGSESAKEADLIVMQPMRGEAELRRYLFEHDYRISDERVVRDGRRFYQVIAAVPNERDSIPEGFPKDYFRFGWVMAKKPEPELLPMLYHYRSVYRRELQKAEAKGSSPQNISEELRNTDSLIRFIEQRTE